MNKKDFKLPLIIIAIILLTLLCIFKPSSNNKESIEKTTSAVENITNKEQIPEIEENKATEETKQPENIDSTKSSNISNDNKLTKKKSTKEKEIKNKSANNTNTNKQTQNTTETKNNDSLKLEANVQKESELLNEVIVERRYNTENTYKYVYTPMRWFKAKTYKWQGFRKNKIQESENK